MSIWDRRLVTSCLLHLQMRYIVHDTARYDTARHTNQLRIKSQSWGIAIGKLLNRVGLNKLNDRSSYRRMKSTVSPPLDSTRLHSLTPLTYRLWCSVCSVIVDRLSERERERSIDDDSPLHQPTVFTQVLLFLLLFFFSAFSCGWWNTVTTTTQHYQFIVIEHYRGSGMGGPTASSKAPMTQKTLFPFQISK